MLGYCCRPLKLTQSLSKQQFLNLSQHTPFENPNENHSSFPEKKKKMCHTDVKRLRRPLEPHHTRLMVEFEANQSKNQGVVFFLVKDMFIYEQKQREKSKKPPRLNSYQHSTILVSSPPTFYIFAFARIF